MDGEEIFNSQFLIATVWHLADALHNTPSKLHPSAIPSTVFNSMKEDYISRLCEYFCFINAFNKLAPSILKNNRMNSFDTTFSEYIELIKEIRLEK